MTEPSIPAGDDSPYPDAGRGHRSDRTWVVGLALIAIGGVFLAEQLIGLQSVNWWALILLIPAFGAFDSAASHYRQRGTALSGSVTGSFITGLSLLAVTAIFLFGLNWSTVWPIFIILAGIGALLGALFH
jgi:hypothetical protein